MPRQKTEESPRRFIKRLNAMARERGLDDSDVGKLTAFAASSLSDPGVPESIVESGVNPESAVLRPAINALENDDDGQLRLKIMAGEIVLQRGDPLPALRERAGVD